MLNLAQVLPLVAVAIWIIGVEYRLWANIRLLRLQQEQLTQLRQRTSLAVLQSLE